ncbi:MAG: hypothetical protein AABX93_01410 [Nanoarchaeota archaeon]
MIKKINSAEMKFIGLVAIIQIILIVSAIAAESYSISQSNVITNNIVEQRKVTKLSWSLANILISFLSIKQIGSVSAAEDYLQCCIETNNEAFCQDVATASATEPASCSNPDTTRNCGSVNECKPGTCIIDNGLSCIFSPSIACDTSQAGVEWQEKTPAEVKINNQYVCRKGCCVLQGNAHFESKAQCDLESGNFLTSINTEAQCIILSQNLLQGACVTNGGGCTFTTGLDCGKRGGSYFKGVLCTNPDLKQLDVSCKPTEKTMIKEDKIYWTDSCGNQANIYDADRTFSKDENYWNVVTAPTCSVYNSDGSINQNKLKSCGNCNQYLSTMAKPKAESGITPDYGDFACRDLNCEIKLDMNDDGEVNTNDVKEHYTKKNGETWCVHDGSIGPVGTIGEGFSSDTVGSEYWKFKCENGEVEVEHSNYRGEVCQERTTTDSINGYSTTTSSLVLNQAPVCFGLNPMQDKKGKDKQGSIDACNANPHCTIREVNVHQNTFNFKVCVPKYPTGFGEDTPAQSYCAVGTVKCPVVYRKSCELGKGCKWKVAKNEDCEKGEFAEKMNNLCISLGDCGSKVNYVGDGTNNVQLKGKADEPSVYGWQNYVAYADASKYTEQEVTPMPTTADGDGGGGINTIFNPEDLVLEQDAQALAEITTNEIAQEILILGGIITSPSVQLNEKTNVFNILGLGGAIISGLAYKGLFGLGTATGQVFIDAGFESQFITGPVANPIASWGYVTLWTFIGAYAGAWIAEQYKITGPAASTLVLAGATAGAAFSYSYFITSNPAFYSNPVGWIAIAIIVVIVVSGEGQTEVRDVEFVCLPWQAPSGATAEDCNKCNDNSLLTCTKYRCESLGQSCTLLNQGTDNPICESITPDDISPVITAGGITQSENYTFENEERGISVDIKAKGETDGCIQEYSQIDFTLDTDEFTQCKWAYKPAADFENFQDFATSGNAFRENHTFTISGLSLGMLEAYEITGDVISGLNGEVKMYVQCTDYHDNINPTPYVVNFCLTQGPDLTPVQLDNTVVATPKNNIVLPYGTNETDLTLYINEPAECKWDYANNDYELMANNFVCNVGASPDLLGRWKCTTSNICSDEDCEVLGDYPIGLTGETTSVHVKCKDQPWETDQTKRNVNVGDYVHTLKVTKTPLLVNSVSVSLRGSTVPLSQNIRGEIKGGGENFKVDLLASTSGGTQSGKAQCSYNFAEAPLAYSGDLFFETFTTSHNQKGLNIKDGNYNISVTCNDDFDKDGIGNIAERSGVFSLVVDSTAPNVVRAYHDGGKLKLVTDEDAKCAYSTEKSYCSSGDIENSTSMTVGFDTEHSTAWNGGQTYYIKCKDVYDKENSGCARVIIPTLEIF